MKAVQINTYGSPDVIEINPDAPVPPVKENQVLVEVKAASINPIDWRVRSGLLKDMVPLSMPVTLGGDFTGIVKETGSGVFDLRVGDEVYGTANVLNGGSGSMAEMASANAANTAFKPTRITFEQAAAFPLVGVSAIQALEDHIRLKPGQRLLVIGGAGGIGSVAIQLAKALGAFVAVSANTDDISFVQGLGADHVIDYTKEAFHTKLHDFDAVFDTVGGDNTLKAFEILKPKGVIVSMTGQPDQVEADRRGITAIGQNTQVNREHLDRLALYVDSGKIKAQIDKTYPLEQAREAFIYQEEVHPQGKVIITVA